MIGIPMTTGSRFWSGARIRAIAAALSAALSLGAAFAQEGIDVEDLTARASAGDKSAARTLADAYYLGRGGVEQDYSAAARYYLALARQGDVHAQTSIGLMYARGYGMKRDLAEARRWWSFAAAKSDPGAQYHLGLLYSQGDPAIRDDAQAVDWYEKAAEAGHVLAQHNLGLMFYEGRGRAQDSFRAYYWLRIATLQGDRAAAKSLDKVAAGMSFRDITSAEMYANRWMKTARNPR